MRQLVARPMASPPTGAGQMAQVVISPDGKWVLWCNANTAPRLYKWDGATYNEVPFTAGGTIYHAAWTNDMTYLVLVTGISGQTVQLRSFNATTGATVVLGGVAGVLANSTILHFHDDDFITCLTGNFTGNTMRAVRINRTNGTISIIASINIASTANSFNSVAVLRNKQAILLEQRENAINYMSLFKVDISGATFVRTSRVNLNDPERAFAVDVTINEGRWHRASRTIAANGSRTGTINADATEITMEPESSYPGNTAGVGQAGVFSAYVFGEAALFIGRETQTPPDVYEIYNPVTRSFVPNGTQITPINPQPGGFTGYKDSGALAKSWVRPRIFAMNFTPGVSPSMVVYEEVEKNDEVTLIADAPMADAIMTTQTNMSARFLADAPMADAVFAAVTDISADIVAMAPMATAFLTTIGQNVRFVADAPMADATFDTETGTVIIDTLAPMATAILRTQQNEIANIGAIVPMAEAVLTTAETTTRLVADAPMADALLTAEAKATSTVRFFVVRKG